MTNCPKCGNAVSEQDAFCPNCGNKLHMQEYCPSCGAKLEENQKFCPSCGRQVISQPVQTTSGDTDKKLVTGLFAIFLGCLGIQYFYLGKTTAGILSIVIALCSCGIWGVVTLIQGILMLTMTEEDFKAKYVDNDRTFPLF